jgi:hypothetical protein
MGRGTLTVEIRQAADAMTLEAAMKSEPVSCGMVACQA